MYKSQHVHYFNRCSFENKLTISVTHPQTIKFYYCDPHLTGLRSWPRPNKSNHNQTFQNPA